jgi:glycerophosphoryl diester phosphodiesterase
MNSDRPLIALSFAALLAGSCIERQGPKPPTFPSGGLLARSVPLPQLQLLSTLEGIYDTTNRFGTFAVVHASIQGSSPTTMKATLAILGRDHFAFAILEPGCFTDSSTGTATVQLVLEGYWRFLEYAEPDSSSTGLIRLFVQPSSVATALCAGQAPPPGASATLVGATGQGNAQPTAPLTVTYVQQRKSRLVQTSKSFFVGAHHGGCVTSDDCGISENTPETFILASQLGADYLEIDVHLTADGIPVCFHTADLSATLVQGPYCFGPIAGYTYAQLVANCRLKNGEIIPRLEDALAYGLTNTNLIVWLDMKTADGVLPTTQLLGMLATRLPPAANVMTRVVMGLPASDVVDAYVSAQQNGQLAPGQRCLVEQEAANVTAIPCIAWSPRYTRGPMASDVQNLQSLGKFVGYWTINDPTVIDAFLIDGKPNGVLTNYLGLVNQRWEVVGTLPPYPVSP